jgi:tetratricopeptide (TPR) repeat protein
MLPLRTIALVVALGAGALLYPLVAPSAQPGGVDVARKALAAGEYDNAITLYTNVLQSERLDTTLLAAVYQERGAARHKSGSPITAIADYTNSIWLGVLPDSLLARSFLDRGIAYVEVGELIRARRDFDNAIAKDAHLADAYFGRATVTRLLGKPQDALSDFDEALRLGHEQAHLVLFGRGLAREMLADRSQAVADFTEAALQAPTFRPALDKLAQLGAAPPSEQEIQAFALSASRRMPAPREAVPPVASIAVADAGEVLTVASTDAVASTGALPPRAPISGPPQILSSARPPEPAPRPGFLRPSHDAVLAEQAVAANLRAGGPDAADLADAEAPTGAIPAASPPAQAETPQAEAPQPSSAVPAEPAKTESVPQPAAAPASQELASAPAIPSTVVNAQPQPPQQPKPTGGAGQFYVQLGAFADRAVADRGAAGFKARFPEIARQHLAAVEPAPLAGRGTVYRVRLGPLATEADSRALCDSLRRNAQACMPVLPARSR